MTPEQDNLFLSIRHATVRYLDKILFSELDFQIREGQQWAVLGKSGSGKTALLNTILGKFNIVNGGISYPFYETFRMKEENAKTQAEIPLFGPRQLIALVSQQAHFRNKQHMSDFYYQQRFNAWDSEDAATVREYLEETLDNLHPFILEAGIRFPLDWVTENLRLNHLLRKTLIKLSNGETRRLLFARALLTQPRLLLLDNPLTGLDVTTRPFFHKLLGAIADKGTQLVIATSPSEISPCITHILELDDGRVKDLWQKAQFTGLREQGEAPWQPDPGKLSRLQKLVLPTTEAFSCAVKLEHIHITYGDTRILEDVCWEVTRGQKWALLGHNGAGKSTLLSLISGDNPQAYANTIYLFDKKRGSGESIWDIKRRIGFLSPEMHQYFMTSSVCLDVVCSGFTDTMNVIRKKITERETILATAWLDLLEIGHLANQKFKEISAGSQRLVLLVRALVKNPPLLILDEPCQGLDTEQKAHFKRVIETLFAANDKTLIYVTHYAEEIPSCVNHILRLEKGRVTA